MEIGELGCRLALEVGVFDTVCDQFWHAPCPFWGAVVAQAVLTASTVAARASFLRWSKGL